MTMLKAECNGSPSGDPSPAIPMTCSGIMTNISCLKHHETLAHFVTLTPMLLRAAEQECERTRGPYLEARSYAFSGVVWRVTAYRSPEARSLTLLLEIRQNVRTFRRKLSGIPKTDRSGQAEAASELEECDFNLMKFELEESDLHLMKLDLRSANEDCRAEDLDGGGLETHG